MSKIIGGKEFGAVDAANVDNNSIFLDTSDNVIKIKGNSGVIGNVDNIPIGTVFAWLKDYPNTPGLNNNWVECNGQTLSDSDSLYNGQIIPDLNGVTGDQRFLRGSSTSGITGGQDTVSASSYSHNNSYWCDYVKDGGHYHTDIDNRPPFYEVVWVMKVK